MYDEKYKLPLHLVRFIVYLTYSRYIDRPIWKSHRGKVDPQGAYQKKSSQNGRGIWGMHFGVLLGPVADISSHLGKLNEELVPSSILSVWKKVNVVWG